VIGTQINLKVGENVEKFVGITKFILKKESSEMIKKFSKIVENTEISKSEKIRKLNELGISRGEIAKLLDIRYQFVRNVLEREIEKKLKSTSN
jgi:hypothetical protein